MTAMGYSLTEALRILKAHEPELRRRGVTHAAVFGSVARGEAGQTSDVDILIDLDPERRLDLFDYVNIKLHIAALFGVDSLDGADRRGQSQDAQAPPAPADPLRGRPCVLKRPGKRRART